MTKMLSALVIASMLGLASAASAAEAVPLTDDQLDNVVAGFNQVGQGLGTVTGTNALQNGTNAFQNTLQNGTNAFQNNFQNGGRVS